MALLYVFEGLAMLIIVFLVMWGIITGNWNIIEYAKNVRKLQSESEFEEKKEEFENYVIKLIIKSILMFVFISIIIAIFFKLYIFYRTRSW